MWIIIILAASLRLFPAHGLSVHADTTRTILPDEFGGLNTFAILQCIIEPGNVSVISRWILPNGSIVTSTNPNERIAMNQGPIVRANSREFVTVLVVQRISYRDAGLYTCEATAITTTGSTSITECPSWPVSDASELQLNAILQAAEEIVVTSETATEVELTCEMAGFIRPDEDLQWFKIDGILSSNIGERYTVTYREGQPSDAQDGGNETVPSRLSVLTISLPQVSDSGTYVCRLKETAMSAEIQLTVLSELPSPTSPSNTIHVGQPPPTPTSPSNTIHVGQPPPTPTSPSNTTHVGQPPPTPTSPSNTTHVGQPPPTPPCPVTGTASDNQGSLSCGQIIGVAVGGTFVITAVLSVILTATAMQLWKKRRQSKETFASALIPLKT